MTKSQVFSAALKGARARRGWNQVELAENIGVSGSAVGNWESGQNMPTAKMMKRISDVLSVPVEFLLGEDPIPYVVPGEKGNVRIERAGRTQRVPVVSWASAGEGGNFGDLAEQIDEWIESDTKDANAYALILEGDSMEPEFKAGDRVIFTPNREARSGDVVVARVAKTGQVFFKKFQRVGTGAERVRLTSFNAAYPALEFGVGEFRFVHPMYALLRRWRG